MTGYDFFIGGWIVVATGIYFGIVVAVVWLFGRAERKRDLRKTDRL